MVTTATGIQSSYDFSTGVKINMDEAIYMLSPMDSPLLTGFGSDGATILGSLPVDEKKFSWMDEEALIPNSQLAAAATTGDGEITVQSGHGQRFSTGDIVIVHKSGGTEYMRVTGYSATTSDIILVTRAYAGTATNYASGDYVKVLGTALAEGSDPEDARSVDRTETYNMTQIFGPTKVSITRTEQGVAKYGITDELGHQMMLRVKENAIAREQAYIYGTRTENTSTSIRTMGGVAYYVTTNQDTTSTQLTVAKIESNMLTCWDAGGLPDQLWVNPKSLSDLNDANNSYVQTVNTETQRGLKRVSYVETEYGDIGVVRNRYVDTADAFGVAREGITRRVFDPLITEKLAKTGDAENWMIVCEEGLQVKGEEHMFRMTALSY